jgi:hypothetical protein
MSWYLSRFKKNPESNMKGIINSGTKAIAVSSFGIIAE